ncbi:MAG: hypothetical protein HQL75_00545 [Magnetococcales bacterium]|nr:hypothetical protein [Magnetococcales bacterium]
MKKEMVEISKEELDELRWDSLVMKALRAAGVDNWDGFDEAISNLPDNL